MQMIPHRAQRVTAWLDENENDGLISRQISKGEFRVQSTVHGCAVLINILDG